MKITKKNYNSYSISELINLGISEAEKGNFSEAEKIYSYDHERFKPYKDLAIKFSNEFSWLKKYF